MHMMYTQGRDLHCERLFTIQQINFLYMLIYLYGVSRVLLHVHLVGKGLSQFGWKMEISSTVWAIVDGN